MKPIPEHQIQFDVFVAAICFLMSRYAQSPDPAVASAVRQHLEQLAAYPACPPTLGKAASRLASLWQGLSTRPEPIEQSNGTAKLH